MANKKSTFFAKLFYSYCHKDAQYRDAMENSLSFLKREGLLQDWSDRSILPGQQISQTVKKAMNAADIMVFLFSPDFIASDACMKEWKDAKRLATEGKPTVRIPIILKASPWQELLANDDVKALPNDGKAVNTFQRQDEAWQQVYEGIKSVIKQLRNNFTPKQEFLDEMNKTDFLSQHSIKLQDIFIFLRLSCYGSQEKNGVVQEEIITCQEQLLEKKRVLVHGEDMSGKTALGQHLFLSLAEEPSTPVLHIDLKDISEKRKEKVFIDTYRQQFNGDYSLWKRQNNKTLILDNLNRTSNIGFIGFAKTFFDRIIIILSSDAFSSFFKDETRLADFHKMKIEPLTHGQQEKLIRKRLALSNREEPVTDGFVDQIENRVNSVIISNKIVPRYPFFVLSILQTYEAFMPDNLSITSYGHCYYVLILAHLIKSGISHSDSDINTCLNFAEHLASGIYHDTDLNYDEFISKYKERFHIQDSILNRLKDPDHGILTDCGHFKTPYMHYFFLGRFLSRKSDTSKKIIREMCENSHVNANYLTLLFTIHHTNDNEIVDDILLKTMCTLDSVRPAELNREETKRFEELIAALRENILSSNSVESEREQERGARDVDEQQLETRENMKETTDDYPVNDCYRILKNNAIMGQILRNKHGNMEKTKVEEIIEVIAAGGLRLVNLVLKDEEEIADLARLIHEQHPDDDIQKIRKFVQFVSFIWTMTNIEKIVGSVNVPEIRESVNNVVSGKSTPAYDLIDYFSQLDNSNELTNGIKEKLGSLLKKHDDPFLRRVLSIRTQFYMKTHRSKAPIQQSICSLLGISYSQQYRLGRNTSS